MSYRVVLCLVAALFTATGSFAQLAPVGGLAAVEGHALTATDKFIPNALVRLRDLDSGNIFAVGKTNEGGFFRFDSVEPGRYVVELLDNPQTVAATSRPVTVGRNDVVATFVKLSRRLPAAAWNSAATIVAVSAAAATAAVLGITNTGRPTSPE